MENEVDNIELLTFPFNVKWGTADLLFNNVFDGDLLQLISINSEAGIEEFDLQNPRYLGYSYQFLDPDLTPDVFKNGTGVYGPLPITMYLDEDGERVAISADHRYEASWRSETFHKNSHDNGQTESYSVNLNFNYYLILITIPAARGTNSWKKFFVFSPLMYLAKLPAAAIMNTKVVYIQKGP